MAPRSSLGRLRKRISRRLLDNSIVHRFLSALIGYYAKFVFITSRWTYVGYEEGRKKYLEPGRRIVVLLWHNRVALMPLGWKYPDYPLTVLISDHRDGRLASGVLRQAGVGCIRVPTSARGDRTHEQHMAVRASTVREILRHVGEGRTISVVGDGPSGPRFRLKHSAIDLARICDAEIVLGTYAVKRRIVLRSWDRLLIPLPFNRGVFRASTWSYDPRALNADEVAALRRRIEEDLRAFTDETDAMLGHSPIE